MCSEGTQTDPNLNKNCCRRYVIGVNGYPCNSQGHEWASTHVYRYPSKFIGIPEPEVTVASIFAPSFVSSFSPSFAPSFPTPRAESCAPKRHLPTALPPSLTIPRGIPDPKAPVRPNIARALPPASPQASQCPEGLSALKKFPLPLALPPAFPLCPQHCPQPPSAQGEAFLCPVGCWPPSYRCPQHCPQLCASLPRHPWLPNRTRSSPSISWYAQSYQCIVLNSNVFSHLPEYPHSCAGIRIAAHSFRKSPSIPRCRGILIAAWVFS